MRVGIGQASYPFEPGSVLVLGGFKVMGAWGLRGPGDADALLHAVLDALLGAAALGDRGDLLAEDGDAPSAVHLATVLSRLGAAGLEPAHLDVTVVIERLDLRAQRSELRERLASLLHMAPGQVSVKSASAGGLGALGRAEGIAAFAVASLREVSA